MAQLQMSCCPPEWQDVVQPPNPYAIAESNGGEKPFMQELFNDVDSDGGAAECAAAQCVEIWKACSLGWLGVPPPTNQ